MRFRRIWKFITYTGFLFLFTIIAAEILLRIYNPFPISVTGDKITLHPNTRKILENVNGPELDTTVVVEKNSLAFRGPEPPKDLENYLSIFTIGGSTTECLFINQQKTWPTLLSNELSKSYKNVWLNNAGLDGHSTYGHIKLLQDYIVKLQPKVCIFLVGCNDVERPDLSKADRTVFNENQNFIISLARYSMLANIGLNYYRHNRAKQRQLLVGLPYALKGFPERTISESEISEILLKLKPDVARYGERLKEIIKICRTANIIPIFLTQPCLLGNSIDDVTGVDLATFPYRDMNGAVLWSEFKIYNAETIRICKEENAKVIDLANQMPKSSKYYYDVIHYNNAGCRKVCELIVPQVQAYVREQLPAFQLK